MKRVIRALSVAVLLVAMVASLATVTTAAGSHTYPDYEADLKYDWELQFLESNAVGHQGWGFDAATPSVEWKGAISIWRYTKDVNGVLAYSYDEEEHAVTLRFNGAQWNALQVNTAQDAVAELKTANAAFFAFQVYFPEDGSFPGLKIHQEDTFARINKDGLFYTYKYYPGALRLPANMQQVGQLQPGWNWITMVGIQQFDDTGAPCDFHMYFGMFDPREGVTGEQLASMPYFNTEKATTLGNMRADMSNAVNQFMFSPEQVGTVEAPTYLGFKGLCMGVLNRKADAFMLKVREMDAVSVEDDPATKYALYLEAKELLGDNEALYFTDNEMTIYKAFEAYIQSLVDGVADAAEMAVADAEEEEKLADKYEIYADVLTMFADLYALSPDDFELPEEFQDALDDYNKQANRANSALLDALLMTAGVANVYYDSNTDIAALLGDIKSKVTPEDDED